MLSDILTGLKVLFPAQAWSGRDFLNFVGGWKWGYIFSLMIEHPFPMNFYFARLFFFLISGIGGWRGVGRGKGRIPIVFCVSACSASCLLAPSAVALERGGKKKTRGAQCHLVL